MKKVFGFLFIFTLIVSSLVAKDFIFEVTPTYNLQNGVLNEYVFYNDSNKQCQKLSELNWNIKNSSELGLNFTAAYKFLDLSLYLGGAIPGISGLMYDSDWQNYEDPAMKTNYSISKNAIDNGFDCDIKISGTITPTTWLKLKPFISYSFNKVYFISSDAEGWYGDSSSMKLHSGQKINVSWDDESALHLKKGELCSIDYYRDTHNFFIGGEADFSFFENFTFLTSVSIAPINYISSVDTHWSNTNKTYGTMYNDRILGYFNYYSGRIGLEYKPLTFMTVGLCGKYSYLHLMKGVTYTKGTATKKYPTKPSTSSYSGASGNLIDASFYVRFNF